MRAHRSRFAAVFLLLAPGIALPSFAVIAPAADTVSGTVINGTTNQPAAGDTVSLIDFAHGMQIAGHTVTDARGRYSLHLPDTGMHLVRVSHQKAGYFKAAPDGAHTADVTVYNVETKVPAVSNEADVLSMQTAPDGELQVSEDFFVRNDSKPPVTQFSSHAYEFYLPQGAKLQGSAAMGPGGLPTESTPVPLAGSGHYAFVFPVRPGESRFQISYTLPYDNANLAWAHPEALPTQNLVVILPKSMNFTSAGADWQAVPIKPDQQTFVLKDLAANQPIRFTVAGQGQLPREAQDTTPNGQEGATGASEGANQTANQTGSQGAATSSTMQADTRPGGGLGPPVDTPDPLHRYKGWLLGGLGVLLLVGAFWLMRSRPAADRRRVELAAGDPESLEHIGPREGIKPAGAEVYTTRTGAPRAENARHEEPRALRPAVERALLALERENALGLIGEEEYTESRAALQKTLHRALAREAAAEMASSTTPRG